MRDARMFLMVALATLAGCGAEVVLGRYLPSSAPGDGGLVDAGSADAGDLDAGAADAGEVDAGEVDGGATDGGGLDAGPEANLLVRFIGEFISDVDAGSFPLQFQVQNTGDAGVSSFTLTLVTPPEVEVLSFPGCTVDAGTSTCAGPALGAFATMSFSATVRFPTTPRWLDLAASVSTPTPESRLDDNALVQPLALTPAGTQSLPVTAPRLLDLTYCVGSNLMTFAACVPGSRAYDTLVFAPDGKLGLLRDGGAILPDGGLTNIDLTRGFFWTQSSDRQNLAFRLTRPDAGVGAGYIGGAVNATCFEGTANNALQVPHGVAWQGCLR